MAEPKKTHRLVKEPQISARFLADYMAASDVRRKTILQSCKYPAIARVIQHNEAKLQIGKYLREGTSDPNLLHAEAAKLRGRMASDDFERDLFDHNADYLDRFAKVSGILDLPVAERLAPGQCAAISREGVKITPDILFRLRRLTSSNKVRVGVASIRYAKGKPLKQDIAEWQSAFLFGYIGFLDEEEGAEPDKKLCITIDGHSGACFAAPSNAITRLKNMDAACAGIAERWDNISPPNNAIL
ncbi:hypothetical protein [Rhizobium hainanense]|uniref:Uncharacterized protein n=1 Tax=Rhizobium hainanense TaxID=52131 RepID=A0A1C3UM11_9HYPH|nr:hypothetical protein [Rhizobium hainanense]SCB16469.1 hypothetical protein GA0061100_102607 [Rhizobium hainanense]